MNGLSQPGLEWRRPSPTALLVMRLGVRLIAYLLAVDQSIASRIGDGLESQYLTESQSSALQLLVERNEQIEVTGQNPNASIVGEWSLTLAVGLGFDTRIRNSFANEVRVMASGSERLDESQPTDFVEMIVALARELYPLHLLPAERHHSRPAGISSFIWRHMWRSDLEAKILEDPAFSSFLTEHDDMGPRSRHVWWSSGRSDSIQISTLCAALISTGWERARMAAVEPSVHQYSGAVRANIRDAKRVIQGNRIGIATKVGLAGAVLAAETDSIDLGVAIIRKRDSRDVDVVDATGVIGTIGSFNQRGESVVIDQAGDLVAEVEAPFEMEDVQGDIWNFSPSDTCVNTREEMNRLIDDVRLALLLAMPERRPTLHKVWSVSIEPISYGSGTSWNPDLQALTGLSPVTIGPNEGLEWRKWLELLHAHLIPEVRVAVRRMLASVSDRRSPEDILVDAVIVWENLFGASTETTLRVSASLAWLLGKSAEDREEKFREYKSIYDFRSKVVHGNPRPDSAKMLNYSRRAVQISIDALREVFENQSDLLKTGRSEDRSRIIMLKG